MKKHEEGGAWWGLLEPGKSRGEEANTYVEWAQLPLVSASLLPDHVLVPETQDHPTKFKCPLPCQEPSIQGLSSAAACRLSLVNQQGAHDLRHTQLTQTTFSIAWDICKPSKTRELLWWCREQEQFSKYGLGTPGIPGTPSGGPWSPSYFHNNQMSLPFTLILSWVYHGVYRGYVSVIVQQTECRSRYENLANFC